ncbi:uncharacterized protein DNG_03319 [Cephalotrichum gorgonifer]|uniref:SRP9 domain-containing protein n=1 Tax=Cephalotrichum gorgonifer TaxID=2041049 RepID=A0AAE8MW07_9PEZI|nr:uncharacterized protein DNG_03319 [Cephalotrichum gorgonifer]
MPGATYYKTSQEWLDNSILLIEAHPTTTRITTKYAIKRPRAATETAPAKGPRANLVLKTYDPTSGATLKYKTSKAAEVNRLVQCMGRLGKGMAGVAGAREALGEPAAATAAAAQEEAAPEKEAEKAQQAPQGGKKKKKGRK